MRVRRDVSSVPFQSAAETWDQITNLITGPGSLDVNQISVAGAVIASIITDEHLSNRALVIEGVGPQLRVYCRYGMKAIEEGGAVDPLSWNPTAGDWTMHVPCDSENIAWVQASLSASSPRIKVFDVDAPENADRGESGSTDVVVDWNMRG